MKKWKMGGEVVNPQILIPGQKISFCAFIVLYNRNQYNKKCDFLEREDNKKKMNQSSRQRPRRQKHLVTRL